MKVILEDAVEADANAVFAMQIAAFRPLLEKYQDYDTNPGNEKVERVIQRINNPHGRFLKILADGVLAGAINIVEKEERCYWISPLFILPEFQGKGLAQRAMTLGEELMPNATSWNLSTILEEEGNCYLYKKMGYRKIGETRKLNDGTTLVYFKKTAQKH